MDATRLSQDLRDRVPAVEGRMSCRGVARVGVKCRQCDPMAAAVATTRHAGGQGLRWRPSFGT